MPTINTDLYCCFVFISSNLWWLSSYFQGKNARNITPQQLQPLHALAVDAGHRFGDFSKCRCGSDHMQLVRWNLISMACVNLMVRGPVRLLIL